MPQENKSRAEARLPIGRHRVPGNGGVLRGSLGANILREQVGTLPAGWRLTITVGASLARDPSCQA